MAIFYQEGENKSRPGVYQRHANIGAVSVPTGQDGICAIPIQAAWGPLGMVVKNTSARDLEKTYGSGIYGTGYTVPAAAAMFDGGATTVYTYRMGSGGKKGEKDITEGVTVTAKYPGTMALSVAIQEKIGDNTKKQCLVYAETALVETWEFTADSASEGEALRNTVAKSAYIDITLSGDTAAATVPVLAATAGVLEGGANPTVQNSDYSAAFAALEPYYYNTIALDVDDDENMSKSLLLQSYLAGAYKMGKLAMAVVGEKATAPFATRLSHARSFNDPKVVYLGGGWHQGEETKDGVLAICYTAGVIAATPSNKGITHMVVNGATDLCESLTYSQYEQAINSGMLMVSLSPDGAVWYDAGINTLVDTETENLDAGWKKIRRVKVRFEMIDRLDRALAPKVGRVSADSDGVADIIQTGSRILAAMANGEGKLMPGAIFMEDPENPYNGDSAWFIIQADDIDSLEKIYLQYQFRYSANV